MAIWRITLTVPLFRRPARYALGQNGKKLYFFSPARDRFGTSLGSYFAPAETWMRVMRTLVGKNFSGSGRVWALVPVPSFNAEAEGIKVGDIITHILETVPRGEAKRVM